jgi:hypothetical protein
MPGQTLSRRAFLKVTLASTLATTVAGVGAFAYAHDIEPRWIEVVQLKLTLPRLHPAFAGYKVVQFSDLHMDVSLSLEELKRIVQLVNDQQPDLIVITGDFVTVWAYPPQLVEGLSGLSAKDGKLAILGNHDHWTDAAAVRDMLRQSSLTDLSNAVHTIRRGDAMLHMGGVDDHWERKDRLPEVLAQLPADGAAILLAHEPDFADISAASGRFDLQLSGHSHGGQVVLPLLGRPLVVPRYAHKYPLGRYQVGSMIQYTNRGVGMIAPTVRFNCRPEITVFSLYPASTAAHTPTG